MAIESALLLIRLRKIASIPGIDGDFGNFGYL